jgi:hypothetical protein
MGHKVGLMMRPGQYKDKKNQGKLNGSFLPDGIKTDIGVEKFDLIGISYFNSI